MKQVFKLNDIVFYPGQGVAEIVGIETKMINNEPIVFYVLKVLYTDKQIIIPITRMGSIGVRKLIKEDEIDGIYEVLKDKKISIEEPNWNRRQKRYLEKIKSGNPYDLAVVIKDIFLISRKKNLSFGERRILETAKSLLAKEIAYVKGKEEAEIKKHIDKIVRGSLDESSDSKG